MIFAAQNISPGNHPMPAHHQTTGISQEVHNNAAHAITGAQFI